MAPTSLLATSRQLVLQSMERAAVASGLDAHTTVGMLSSHAHDLVGHPDNKYVMFRKEDATAWMVFTVSFAILIIFDNFVLNGERRAIGIGRAAVYTVFWMLCAGAFACWVFFLGSFFFVLFELGVPSSQLKLRIFSVVDCHFWQFWSHESEWRFPSH